MAGQAGRSELVAAIGPTLGEAHASQSLQAGAVLKSRWPAGRLAQEQPVKGGPAAGLEIGLVPHRVSNRRSAGARQGGGRGTVRQGTFERAAMGSPEPVLRLSAVS